MEKSKKLIIDDTEYTTEIPESSLRPFHGLPDRGHARAFIPGTVIEIRVSPGEKVKPGKVLVVLDAMKMHNEICVNVGGTVSKVHVNVGDRVSKDQLLVEVRH